VPPDDATAAWEAMRALVESNERREELRQALGLGRGSGRVKALLALAERSPLTLGELADKLAVDAPYATLIVNHMEALGLVARSADPGDRRRKLVSLTAHGKRATAQARAIHGRPPEGFAQLGAEELAQLRGLLERLAINPAGRPDAA
jgi:DNA-binding MarR family transcriptional regulator